LLPQNAATAAAPTAVAEHFFDMQKTEAVRASVFSGIMGAFRRSRVVPLAFERPISRKEPAMRVAGPLLTLSALLIAAPALAQGDGYYDPGGPNTWERYEYYPPPQGQMWHGPMHHGPVPYGQWHSYPQQSGSPWQQQGPYGGYPPPQTGAAQTGQKGSSTPGPVSFATPGQIKSSLESSGFKNVAVLPQSFLIRATAPDGSRILMQVSSDSLYGVVVNPSDQAGPGKTPGSAGTGATSSSTGGTSSAGGSTGTSGGTSSTGATDTGSTGSASSSTEQNTSR
jgi:hypothetical protein